MFITGCSVSKSGGRSKAETKEINIENIYLSEILKQNMTSVPFFIQKAEIEIINQGEKQKFTASLKYSNPDSFLLILRSSAGIEVGRIFLSGDTILVNDRMNKILFFGSHSAVKKKYGISSQLLPVYFGDFVTNTKEEFSIYKCDKGNLLLEALVDGYKINYFIDCQIKKSFSLTITREIDTKPVSIKFIDFEKEGELNLAKRIIISNLNNIEIISIRFSKIEIPWEGSMHFIPGNNYEHIEIK